MYRVEFQPFPSDRPATWQTLGGEYDSRDAVLRAIREHQSSPAGYATPHRVLDAAGEDVTEGLYL